MEALGINLPFLLVQIVNLLIVYTVVAKWIVGPVGKMLEQRRETIAQGVEDSRVAAEARANAEEEAAKIKAEAQGEASKIVSDATERAQSAGAEVKAAAEADAAKAKEKALTDVEAERNQMLGDLRGQVAALAISGAQKLVGEALDEKKQHALLSDFFAGVKSGKVIVLGDADLKGDAAEITSALPLTDAEEATVKKDVLAKSGAEDVSFLVDPAILGGLVIKVGDKVVDGSVAGKLEGLRQNMR
ncbi:MAG: F0F1 ATP synthase subunit B [Anaerolineae bacterium]|jgi:F-type H+-transporting ATPase subunit b|nr:F0F1 ATP synthase subunit B [Anaerolineae bacterium]MBT3711867.1 F0F1 ATP synthase subunit B [Anaerolineae bacterium]MBT4311125.1 F0F1 ATP synthase subunit B [Anaerolineae bacterium]MBT4459386.1 F0F1 ATP synthase subunit B [Anaerolineae bacterium]MBT4841288.1 F0F1 ATP synthase subunit B [Anaerolineae bacterium]